MAYHANPAEMDSTFVGQDLISEECGLSIITVKRQRKFLAARKFISRGIYEGRKVWFVHPLKGIRQTPANVESGISQDGGRYLSGLPQVSIKPIAGISQDTSLTYINRNNIKGTGSPADTSAKANTENATPNPKPRAMWQLLRDEETISKRLNQEKEKSTPSQQIIEALRFQLKTVRAEIADCKPANVA